MAALFSDGNTVDSIVEFFWNGLTKTDLIDPTNNYRQIYIGLKFLDKVVCNGWSYTTPPGEYLTPDIIVELIQAFSQKINSEVTNNSNPLILKVHKPGIGDRNNKLRHYEYYNLNSVVPYMSIVVTLRTTPNALPYYMTPLEAYNVTTGSTAASDLSSDGADMVNVQPTTETTVTSTYTQPNSAENA